MCLVHELGVVVAVGAGLSTLVTEQHEMLCSIIIPLCQSGPSLLAVQSVLTLTSSYKGPSHSSS